MHEIIAKIEASKKKSIEQRRREKIEFDSKFSELSLSNDKLVLDVSQNGEKQAGMITLFQEGAVVDTNDIRFVFARGTALSTLNQLLDSGISKLEVNVDHESGVLTGAIGFVDLTKAQVVDAENNTKKLEAPIVFDTSAVAVAEIRRQQDLGMRFGVSIEISDEGFVYEENEQSSEILIRNFLIKNLSIVREGANVTSNYNLFNLNNMKNKNLNVDENVNNEEIKVESQEVQAENAEAEVDVVEAVAEVQAQNDELTAKLEEAEKLKAEAEAKLIEAEAKAKEAEAKTLSVTNAIKSKINVKKLEVNKKLAATEITPWTGTNFQPPVNDLSAQANFNDAVVNDLLRNDDDVAYAMQPLDVANGIYTPIVKSLEFYGWELNSFDPTTECCWKVDATGTAGQAQFTMGTACTAVDSTMWQSFYTSQGAFGTGLSPIQTKLNLAIDTLKQRAIYGLLQGDPFAPPSAIPAWDGLASVFGIAPTQISAAGSIIAALDTVIARFSLWFGGEVSPDGQGLVAYLHPLTARAIADEMRRKQLSGVCCLTLAEKNSLGEVGTALTYKGIRFVTSKNIILDVSGGATDGLSEIYVTVEGNVASKLKYLSMNDGQIEFSTGNDISPIQIGATTMSAVPGCELTSTVAFFAVGGTYAKSRMKLARITGVQALPYGSSMINGMRSYLGVNFSGSFDLN